MSQKLLEITTFQCIFPPLILIQVSTFRVMSAMFDFKCSFFILKNPKAHLFLWKCNCLFFLCTYVKSKKAFIVFVRYLSLKANI